MIFFELLHISLQVETVLSGLMALIKNGLSLTYMFLIMITYASCVFEGIRVYETKIFKLEEHR